MTLLSGKASHVSNQSHISGSFSGGSGGVAGGGSVSTTHTTLFRVGNRPARFGKTVNLVDGEDVTLVGFSGDEFIAIALRNDSTGITYYNMTFYEAMSQSKCTIAAVLLSLAAAFLTVVGILFLCVGLYAGTSHAMGSGFVLGYGLFIGAVLFIPAC